MVRPYRFIDYLLWQVKETLLKTIDKPCSSQPKRGVTDSTLPATNCCVLYRLKKVIDNAVGSQPKRHHILRCCVRPFAVVLVDKTQLTTCVFRDPRGATYAALRVTYRYAHCRLLVVAEELLKHILLFQLFCYYEQFIIPFLAEAFD